MFPHRTGFYDREEDEILYPDEMDNYIEYGEKGTKQGGHGPYMKSRGIIFCIDEFRGRHREGEDYFIALASTGLEDSEGQEIFEGHTVGWNDHVNSDRKGVVFWDMNRWAIREFGSHVWDLVDGIESKDELEFSITGHALTDPDLVPDGFDVEEYFGLEEQANAH